MDRLKIVDWTNYKTSPTLTQNDDWVVGDSGVNKVQINVDNVFNGYSIDLFISRYNQSSATLYLGNVVNGTCNFSVDNKVISNGLWEMSFRLVKDDVVIASCQVSYKITCGKVYDTVFLSDKQTETINDLIDELKKATIEAGNMKNLLAVTTNTANQVNNQLEDTITAGNDLDSKLTIENSSATDNISSLNTLNNSAGQNITSLGVENRRAETNITDLGNSNTTAFNNIRSLTTQNSNATNNINDLATQNGSATSNIQDLTTKNTEAATNLQNLQNKIDEVPGEIKKITDEGDKQVERVSKLGTLNYNSMTYFTEWLGSQSEFDSALKYMDRKYSVYADNGEILSQYYYKSKAPTDYFDSRLSLVIQGTENGLFYWNAENDPMPFKITGKLRITEEVKGEYQIVMDGSPETDVQIAQYVVGTYQEHLDREKDRANSIELIKEKGIEWGIEDTRKEIMAINEANLNKLRMRAKIIELDENGNNVNEMPILSSRTVYVPVDCCFRVDLKTGEIYVGPGYENIELVGRGQPIRRNEDGTYNLLTGSLNSMVGAWNRIQLPFEIPLNEKYTFTATVLEYKNNDPTYDGSYFGILGEYNIFGEQLKLKELNKKETVTVVGDGNETQYKSGYTIDSANTTTSTAKIKIIATKTDREVPYVKSQFPGGKMSFLTGATEQTHTFLLAGTNTTFTANGNEVNLYGNTALKNIKIYKGLLTEEQKTAELNKTLILSEAYNQISKFF